MNPVLMLTHNALEMTKRAVESCEKQDIPAVVRIIDNGSTDGTVEWADRKLILYDASLFNNGVSAGWNQGLKSLFRRVDVEHVLVCNNDVELPEWFYGELLACEVPFVTGVSCDHIVEEAPPRGNLVPHPDFSAFLIRRSAWEAIGPFDEGMKHYAGDLDYHVRASQVGVPLLAGNFPFYHERSSTLRLASPEDRREIELQADRDRAYFHKKWNFAVGSEEYQKATQCLNTVLPSV